MTAPPIPRREPLPPPVASALPAILAAVARAPARRPLVAPGAVVGERRDGWRWPVLRLLPEGI